MRRKRNSSGKIPRAGSPLRKIRVRARAGRGSQGWLAAGGLRIAVALGAAGIRADKREGDRATPRGSFRLVRLWWRKDRARRPPTRLPARPIRRADAWCENPADRRYNRPIRLGADAPGDRLWREDHLYDLLVELDHNTRPRVAGRGSAVFLHLARQKFRPTAGCVALAGADFRRLLARLGPKTRIVIE
jgi:L,D-peptidoglycan transpeptidase YkuD (ErfK/YbiS/YcfS/YnhG family)